MTGKIYMNQTIQFPVKSSQGNSSAIVLYNYDSNDILTRYMKNRTKEAIAEKYKELHGTLLSWVLRPQIQILYN